VEVNIPPKSGDHKGQAGYAEVTVTSKVARSFTSVFSHGACDVVSRAVAAGTFVPTSGSVLVLEPKKKNALQLKGKNTILEAKGDVFVNSRDKKALKVDKKGQIKADHLLVSGSIDRKSKGLIDADISTGVTPTEDPFTSLPPPAKGTVQKTDSFKSVVNVKETYNLTPGTYKELKFDKNDVVTMQPGVYYVDGEVRVHGQASLSANEVMIYNGSKKGFKFDTTGSVTITPPTSGTYEGVSLFQNPLAKAKIDFRKGTDIDVNGVIYAPKSKLSFKDTTMDSGGYSDEEDEDWELDPDNDDGLGDDGGTADSGSINAAVVVGALSLDKKSRVVFNGVNVNVKRPLTGLVE